MTTKKNNNPKEAKVTIKVSHGKLHHEIAPALKAIGEFKDIEGVETTLNVVKMQGNVEAALEAFQKTRKKIIEDAAEVGEDGKPKTKQETRPNPYTGKADKAEVYIFKSMEEEKAANWKLQELDEKEVTVEIFPITYMDIKDCAGLSPNIIKAAGACVTL